MKPINRVKTIAKKTKQRVSDYSNKLTEYKYKIPKHINLNFYSHINVIRESTIKYKLSNIT